MDERDLKGHLDRLSTRGTPRGADDVLEAARSRAAVRPLVAQLNRYVPAVAIAAAVILVGALVIVNHGSGTPQFAADGVNTVPPSSTTEKIPEVSIPAKLIAQSRLVPYANCGTFTSYMRAKALQYVGPYGLPSTGMGGGRETFAAGQAAGAAAPSMAEDNAAQPQAKSSQSLAATGGDEYSTTNVQEAGIDEPDVVKTDGKRIYALSNGKFFVVDAASPHILGSFDVGYASEMFVDGGRAVVFSGGGGPYYGQPVAAGGGVATADAPASNSSSAQPAPYRQQARITVLDVSSPSTIKMVSHVDVDGNYISARLVNGVARVVLSSYSSIQYAYPQDGSPSSAAAALAKNRDLVSKTTYADWVPHYTVTDAAGHTSAEKPAVACGSAYHPPQFSGFGQLSVMSIDPHNPAAAKTTTVTADGQVVYSSASRLYVATSQWGEIRPMAADAQMAPSIAPPSSPKTLVHEFDISDPAQAQYRVSGTVRGSVLNQFSMSEHEGVFRIATTDNNESYVTTMSDQSGKVLDQIGQVGGLGKGERIYAVRFIGPLGYVVTYKQVDPLYVVDLHVPTKPRVVGELEVQGFSAYLHPVSDTLLIGVGQDAGPNSPRDVAQVSLFDVSNPAAPKMLQRLPFGSMSSYSQAEVNHHAFLYWAPKQLAVIPVQQYEQSGQSFQGAIGMHVAPSGIKEVGRVSHDQAMVDRSFVIGDRLFTFSYAGIKANNIDTFAEQAWVPFPQPPPPPQPEPQTKPGAEPGSTPPAAPDSGGADGGPAR